eukprot:2227207-Pleurochrysis_carterae.AAC.1
MSQVAVASTLREPIRLPAEQLAHRTAAFNYIMLVSRAGVAGLERNERKHKLPPQLVRNLRGEFA